MSPATVRGARTQTVRTCRLETLDDGAQVLTLTVTTGRKQLQTAYLLTQLPSDFGIAFELRKAPSQGGEVYHVCLDGRESSCDCLGHLAHRHCKHADGLARLKELGLL